MNSRESSATKEKVTKRKFKSKTAKLTYQRGLLRKKKREAIKREKLQNTSQSGTENDHSYTTMEDSSESENESSQNNSGSISETQEKTKTRFTQTNIVFTRTIQTQTGNEQEIKQRENKHLVERMYPTWNDYLDQSSGMTYCEATKFGQKYGPEQPKMTEISKGRIPIRKESSLKMSSKTTFKATGKTFTNNVRYSPQKSSSSKTQEPKVRKPPKLIKIITNEKTGWSTINGTKESGENNSQIPVIITANRFSVLDTDGSKVHDTMAEVPYVSSKDFPVDGLTRKYVPKEVQKNQIPGLDPKITIQKRVGNESKETTQTKTPNTQEQSAYKRVITEADYEKEGSSTQKSGPEGRYKPVITAEDFETGESSGTQNGSNQNNSNQETLGEALDKLRKNLPPSKYQNSNVRGEPYSTTEYEELFTSSEYETSEEIPNKKNGTPNNTNQNSGLNQESGHEVYFKPHFSWKSVDFE